MNDQLPEFNRESIKAQMNYWFSKLDNRNLYQVYRLTYSLFDPEGYQEFIENEPELLRVHLIETGQDLMAYLCAIYLNLNNVLNNPKISADNQARGLIETAYKLTTDAALQRGIDLEGEDGKDFIRALNLDSLLENLLTDDNE